MAPNAYTIGRAEGADIVIASTSVSRTPIRVDWNGSGFELFDPGNRGSVVINGYPLAGRRPIRAGDKIRIGDVTIGVQAALDPAATVVQSRAPVYAAPYPAFAAAPAVVTQAPAVAPRGPGVQRYLMIGLSAVAAVGGVVGIGAALGWFGGGSDGPEKAAATSPAQASVATQAGSTAATAAGSAAAQTSPTAGAAAAQGSPPVVTPATPVTPVTAAAPGTCTRIASGCEGFVINSPYQAGTTDPVEKDCLNFRQAPGGTIISKVCGPDAFPSKLMFLEGPMDVAGFRWWKVRVPGLEGGSTDGYMAEVQLTGSVPAAGAPKDVGPWLALVAQAVVPVPPLLPPTGEPQRQPQAGRTATYDVYERIRWAAGASIARVSGLTGRSAYHFGAGPGQLLNFEFKTTVNGSRCRLRVWSPHNVSLVDAEVGNPQTAEVTLRAAVAGDYLVVVEETPGGCGAFDLEIQFRGLGVSPPRDLGVVMFR